MPIDDPSIAHQTTAARGRRRSDGRAQPAQGPDATPPPGTLLCGKYEVAEILGDGGMGVVVAARHVTLDRKVALKFLKREAAARSEAVGRFLREAQAASALQSEHVARVLDVGTLDDGRPFMVMEHLTGRDMGEVIDHEVLGVPDAVGYILQVCEAIAEAHQLGVVHRDLKPSNLFLTQHSDGTPLVKVLDFGIAKALDETAPGVNASLTATGMALGSPAYMAPEQVRNAKDVDRRTDIWGIGAVLYELLGRAAPFDADTVPALSAKIIADEPQPLRELRDDVPPALEAVVARCLMKRPEDRYPNVALLADDLAPFAPPEARPLVARIARVVSGRFSIPESTPTWSGRDGGDATRRAAGLVAARTVDGVCSTADEPSSDAERTTSAVPRRAGRWLVAVTLTAGAVATFAASGREDERPTLTTRLAAVAPPPSDIEARVASAAPALDPPAADPPAADPPAAADEPAPSNPRATPVPLPPPRPQPVVVAPPSPTFKPNPEPSDAPIDPLLDRK